MLKHHVSPYVAFYGACLPGLTISQQSVSTCSASDIWNEAGIFLKNELRVHWTIVHLFFSICNCSNCNVCLNKITHYLISCPTVSYVQSLKCITNSDLQRIILNGLRFPLCDLCILLIFAFIKHVVHILEQNHIQRTYIIKIATLSLFLYSNTSFIFVDQSIMFSNT